MSLTDIFPVGVADIPLLYLSLPELWKAEEEDPEVEHILEQDYFWRARLRNEYNISEEELAGIEDPRSEYQFNYFLDLLRAAEEGYLFEAGQMCLPLTREDNKFLGEIDATSFFEFKTGRIVGGCGSIPGLQRMTSEETLDLLLALHSGDEKVIRTLRAIDEKIPSENILANVKFMPGFHPFSKQMVDNAIRWGVNPVYMRDWLYKGGRLKDLYLADYIDNGLAHLYEQVPMPYAGIVTGYL